jgi:hypothetical protein
MGAADAPNAALPPQMQLIAFFYDDAETSSVIIVRTSQALVLRLIIDSFKLYSAYFRGYFPVQTDISSYF